MPLSPAGVDPNVSENDGQQSINSAWIALKRAYISLGSNQGDAFFFLQAARERLEAFPGVRISAVSSIFRTEPQSLSDQPFFSNQVMRLLCVPGLSAVALLEMMLAVEADLGRSRLHESRFGPRCIDLDLLLFGNDSMHTEQLILPHPRMLTRAFILLPLAEIEPDMPLPQGMTVSEALGRIDFIRVRDVILQKDCLL